MMLDPARWPDPLRLAVLGAAVAVFALSAWVAPTSALAIVAVLLVPPLVGGLIWRFDGLPWIDIASWTLPLAGWLAINVWIVPGSVHWVIGGISVAAWLYAFIFWTGVTRWWYRWLLRKPFPRTTATP